MKIVLVGGGSGGHFYPLIAVAEALEDIAREKHLIEPDLYYIGPPPFDNAALQEHEIRYMPSSAGKVRRYASVLNVLGFFQTAAGCLISLTHLFRLYPDAVFSTGGYAAFPTLWAARILRIPVIIYDADATPGRVSVWSGKFARWIAVAHPNAAEKFPSKYLPRIALTGHPIRAEIEAPAKEGGHEFLKLDKSVPTIFVMGGSLGAQRINETVLDALPVLVQRYNVVHQTGAANLDEVAKIASVQLRNSPNAERYRPFALLNALALRMAGGIASLVIARAGSGTIFEVASWGVPAILVPIPKDVSHDQIDNAFSYARAGAAEVLEQHNLTPHLLAAEVDRLMSDASMREKMAAAARVFARPQAARTIATVLVETALEHEPS